MKKETRLKVALAILFLALCCAAWIIGDRLGYRAGQLDYSTGLVQWTIIDGIEIRIYGPARNYNPAKEADK